MKDEGISRRDRIVIDACMSFGVPLACYVGGGYAEDLDVLALRHCSLHFAALDLHDPRESEISVDSPSVVL